MNYELRIMKSQKEIRIVHSPYSIAHGGFSLVEILFYTAILAVALVAVMQTLVVIVRSYGVLRASQRIEQEATASMERIVREIRDASSVDDAGSVLGSSPGELLLNTTDAAGTAKTVEFYLDSGRLSLKENGVVSGLLSSSKTSVSNLVFRKITTARSAGVKIELTFKSGVGIASSTESFYGTAVLRDSY